MVIDTEFRNGTVQALLHQDQEMIDRLLRELETFNDAEMLQDRFVQLYRELSIHAAAEAAVIYPAVLSFYGTDNVQQRHGEQAEINVLLYEMKILSPLSPEFKEKLGDLKQLVSSHFYYEKSTLFVAMSNHLSTAENNQLAIQFNQVRLRLRDEVDAVMKAN